MWHSMFVQGIPYGEKVLRTVLVYLLVAILIRIAGKRSLAALNSLDIVVISLLSNVVQNAIIGNDLSVTGAAVGAAVLMAVNGLANRLAMVNPFFAKVFDGTDTRLIEDGTIQPRAMWRVGLRRPVLDHAVQMQNGTDVSDVQDGVLEAGGQLLLTLRPEQQGATKGDVDRLAAQLARIEAALATTKR